MFCYVAANKNLRKLTGSYWMRNLEIIPMIEKLKGKKQWGKPLDILSRYKFFLPFNSSESAGGHKTCRDTLNANLPALPRTGYTVSNTVHTTYGISSIPPAPLPTIPDSNWIKGNLSTKKNNKPIKLFVFEKKNIISIIFPFQNILPEYRTLENHVNSDAIPCTMWDWCSCASSVSVSLAFLTPSQVDITH